MLSDLTDVVATFGAKVSKPQLDLLREFPKVTIFMDGDAPGRSATHNLIDALREYVSLTVIDTPDGEDPASLDAIPKGIYGMIYELSNKIS